LQREKTKCLKNFQLLRNPKQSRHRLPAHSAEQTALLATTPAEEFLALPMLQPDQVTDPLKAYQFSKRANSLRVMAEAVRWGKRGAGYRRMIDICTAGRAGTPDEVGTVGALLMRPDGAFVTGSDFLMDGGVTAAYWFGELAPR
jgi:NAD(P)-dependent dehydrogenase (short-subunit alcohol dehydrogenase family)